MKVDDARQLSRDELLGHCLWLLERELEPMLHQIGGFQEVSCLMGRIQGVLVAYELFTILEVRGHTERARRWKAELHRE